MKLRAKPVVGLDRRRKAKMIAAFLEDALGSPPERLRILDLGSGNGDICAHFDTNNFAVGIDVKDQVRAENVHIPRCVAQSERLPFSDHCFDVVISHHVIEHVTDHAGHVSEIRRVLKRGGVCYLGTPNLSSPLMRGHVGNPMVLRYREMRPLFENHGFEVEECYIRFLHEPERYHCDTTIGRLIPVSVLALLRYWFPSHCFLLWPSAPDSSR